MSENEREWGIEKERQTEAPANINFVIWLQRILSRNKERNWCLDLSLSFLLPRQSCRIGPTTHWPDPLRRDPKSYHSNWMHCLYNVMLYLSRDWWRKPYNIGHSLERLNLIKILMHIKIVECSQLYRSQSTNFQRFNQRVVRMAFSPCIKRHTMAGFQTIFRSVWHDGTIHY